MKYLVGFFIGVISTLTAIYIKIMKEFDDFWYWGDNMTWININNTLYKCPYCGAVQFKRLICRYCKRKVTEWKQ